MNNYLVINGVTYVFTELPSVSVSSCDLCAFKSQCDEMIEFPFCELFGFCSRDEVKKIFVKAL